MKRQFLQYLFAAGAALALAACGGGSSSSEPAPTPASAASTKTVVDLAVATPDLSTLVTAVTEAGLAETLSGPGPFTVFAPTNAAFDKLGSATVASLLADTKTLADILTYHVVPGKVLKADIPLGKSITTVEGGTITINVEGADVIITDAKGGKSKIVTTDIMASNGVVHLIDTVIMPAEAAEPTEAKNIVELANATPNLSTLVTAVTRAGLTQTLSGPGPFTVFAPTNAAFNKLPAGTLNTLLGDPKALANVLKYHVVSGKVLKAGIPLGKPIMTVQGGEITIDAVGADVIITDAKGRKSKIVVTDIMASNGVVHVIDTVILPPEAMPAKNIVELAAATPNLSTLVTAVTAAGLTETLSGPGPFTVFAPTNAAFTKLGTATIAALLADKAALTNVLTYHVVAGKVLKADIPLGKPVTTVQKGTLTINVEGNDVVITDAKGGKSKIVMTDIMASNGVVHVIDTVIMPAAPAPTKNIVELAQGNPELSILVEAVIAADLDMTLSGKGPFTVFAPNNAAFAALLKELKITKEALLKDKPLLTAVLTYHVVGAKVLKADIPFGKPIKSAQGQTFTIDQTATITDARHRKSKIIATDVLASNGVVHVIDKVILPVIH
jgi:transforming growth factor-beta-induced protein